MNHEIETAERAYDLNRVAELKHGELPKLQAKLAAETEKLEKGRRAASGCCAKR